MTRYEAHLIDTLREFRQHSAEWDDLWLRSDVTAPSARAEFIAECALAEAPGAAFRTLVVKSGERIVAGLPLVAGRALGLYSLGLFSLGILPRNGWAPSGTLLLDPDCDAEAALDALIGALAKLPWRVLMLDQLNIDRPCWSALAAAAKRRGVFLDIVHRGSIGWLTVPDDWDAYERSWTKNHRHKMKRALRRLQQYGDYRFRFETGLDPADAAELTKSCFAVEDASWKGTAGTSILRTPGKGEFYVRQAQQLAGWGQLMISLLELEGRAIAFDYGWLSKGIYHARKVGFHPDYAAASPGQLLQLHLLKHFAQSGAARAIDCMGPLDDAMRCWQPTTYNLGRVVLATRGRLWQAAYAGYASLWRKVRARKLARRRGGAHRQASENL